MAWISPKMCLFHFLYEDVRWDWVSSIPEWPRNHSHTWFCGCLRMVFTSKTEFKHRSCCAETRSTWATLVCNSFVWFTLYVMMNVWTYVENLQIHRHQVLQIGARKFFCFFWGKLFGTWHYQILLRYMRVEYSIQRFMQPDGDSLFENSVNARCCRQYCSTTNLHCASQTTTMLWRISERAYLVDLKTSSSSQFLDRGYYWTWNLSKILPCWLRRNGPFDIDRYVCMFSFEWEVMDCLPNHLLLRKLLLWTKL